MQMDNIFCAATSTIMPEWGGPTDCLVLSGDYGNHRLLLLSESSHSG